MFSVVRAARIPYVPTPVSQNLEAEQQVQIFGSTKSEITNVSMLELMHHERVFFFEGVNDGHFGNHGVISYAMIPRCRPYSTIVSPSSHL
jgi:hypothetical protein